MLGNVGTADDIALLERVRGDEPDDMLREHAAWALERLPHRADATVPAPAAEAR